MASPEVLDYIQLAEARNVLASEVTGGSGDVALDEKGGSYIYVLPEDRAVKLPHEALLEAAQLFKQGEPVLYQLHIIDMAGLWALRIGYPPMLPPLLLSLTYNSCGMTFRSQCFTPLAGFVPRTGSSVRGVCPPLLPLPLHELLAVLGSCAESRLGAGQSQGPLQVGILLGFAAARPLGAVHIASYRKRVGGVL